MRNTATTNVHTAEIPHCRHFLDTPKVTFFAANIDLDSDVGKDTYLWACSDLGAAPMAAILKSLGKTDINLSSRNMGSKSAIALASALKVDCRFVCRLDRSICENECTGQSAISRFLHLAQKNSRVESLNVADNGMGPEGGAHIAAAMAENKTIVQAASSLNVHTSLAAQTFPPGKLQP